jgi:hypothetical protein
MKNLRATHSVRRVIAVTLLCSSSLLATTGCFGSFSTLHRVYEWNRTVDHNKWVQWGVFTAAIIVPVYPSATLFDLVFTNSVEFWSGRNPMTAGVTRTLHTENGEEVSMRMREDGNIDVSIRSPSQPDTQLVVVPEGDSIAAYDASGQLVARAVEAGDTTR